MTGFLYKLEQEVVRDILSQANFEILANFGIWHQKPTLTAFQRLSMWGVDMMKAYRSISSKIGVWSCLAPESIMSDALICSAIRSEVMK